MQLLKTIGKLSDSQNPYRMREASRVVAFDENNFVPILYVSKFYYHKLPGSGVAVGESKEMALHRELQEEVGANIGEISELGMIIEYREEEKLKQISYCYTADITEKGDPRFTEKEIRSGFQIKRMKLDEAITTLENDQPTNKEGFFIQKRDLSFLKKAKEFVDAVK